MNYPTITIWNRVEGTPRAEQFTRALKAEVRDPLWMLSKQWLTGEFMGEDAASVIKAKVHMRTTKLTKYQPGENAVRAMDDNVPMEVQVEHQSIPFESGKQIISLDLRLLMGRHWFKMLKKAGFALESDYETHYLLSAPDPTHEDWIQVCAHTESWQQFAAVGGRRIDGYKLYQDLSAAGALATDVVTPPAGRETELDDLGKRFVAWFEKLYFQPADDGNPSWKPSYLEHQFSCSAPEKGGEKVFMADEYYHGHLDWYNLDIRDNQDPLDELSGGDPASPEDSITMNFLPTPVTFPGMPHRRWWTLEDWKTNLGSISPNTTDINQLMLLDFAVNYANDWFVLPFTLPVGSISNVAGVMVTNVFGEKVWIEPAGEGGDEDWQRWSMYKMNIRGDREIPADLSLALLPAVQKTLEGKPLEEIYLLRDEIANMVWGVESMVPLPSGKSKAGKAAGIEIRAKHMQFATPAPPIVLSKNEAKIKYQIVNSVLEHWIPFIPVHKENSNRQIQVQRAAMPRILEGTESSAPPRKIEPRTSLLRHGLDESIKQTYFLHEEEIPRAGIRVTKSYQRTRWYNGRVFTWLGIRKRTGRGGGHSGLVFDQILPKERGSSS